MAVGTGLLLRGAQRFNLPHRLTDLQLEVVPGLLELAAGALLRREPEDENDIHHAAHKEHELHRCLIAVGEETRIDTGHIVRKVACQRHHAELQLHGARIMGKAAGRRRDIAQQGDQQRQCDQHLNGRLQPVGGGRHQRDHQKRRPAPELTAQVCCKNGDGGPEPISAEDAEDSGKGQMGGKRIRLLRRRPAIHISNERLHQEYGC